MSHYSDSISSYSESAAQEEQYQHVRVLGKGAFGEAVLYRKVEVRHYSTVLLLEDVLTLSRL